MNLHIPPDLGPLLQDFTVAVLAHSPRNLVDFAVEHFKKIQEETESKDSQGSFPGSHANPGESQVSSVGLNVCFVVDWLVRLFKVIPK